jgi:hypothetical protein
VSGRSSVLYWGCNNGWFTVLGAKVEVAKHVVGLEAVRGSTGGKVDDCRMRRNHIVVKRVCGLIGETAGAE